MARAELRANAKSAFAALLFWAAAAVATVFASVLICISGIHFLLYLFPAVDAWLVYGSVGLLVLAMAITLYFAGRSRARSVNLLPAQTVASVAEDFRMIHEALP